MRPFHHTLKLAMALAVGLSLLASSEADAQSNRRQRFQRGNNRSAANASPRREDRRRRDSSGTRRESDGDASQDSDQGQTEYRYRVTILFNSFTQLTYLDNKDLDPWNEFQLNFVTEVPTRGQVSHTIPRLTIDTWKREPGNPTSLISTLPSTNGDGNPAWSVGGVKLKSRVESDLDLLDPVIDQNGDLLADEISVRFFGKELDANVFEGPEDPLQDVTTSIVFDSQAFGNNGQVRQDLVLGDDARTYQISVTVIITRIEYDPTSSPTSGPATRSRPPKAKNQNLRSQYASRSNGQQRSGRANVSQSSRQNRQSAARSSRVRPPERDAGRR